jgi:hypothetical protein
MKTIDCNFDKTFMALATTAHENSIFMLIAETHNVNPVE